MTNKRAEIEFMYWTGTDPEDIYLRLTSKYPGIAREYVMEVCEMMDGDDSYPDDDDYQFLEEVQ